MQVRKRKSKRAKMKKSPRQVYLAKKVELNSLRDSNVPLARKR